MIENGSRAATPRSRRVGSPQNVAAGRREVIARATPNVVAAVGEYNAAAVEQAA